MRMRASILAAAVLTGFGLMAAQAPDFSGLWKLNLQKSRWGNKQKPATVMVEIQHKELAFAYSGMVVNVHGEARSFDFKGALDGREYPAVRPCGEGKAILERVGPYSVIITFKSNDGAVVERTRMTVSRDGKTLTYSVQLKDPGGQMSWTEVYER